jgi:hypothetical protein
MIHYSCDRCKKPIHSNEFRHIVKIEVQTALSDGPHPLDEERDHLVEIEEILSRMEERDNEDVSEELYQRKTFDLCPLCYQQYMRNPLAIETASQFGFSQN